ncbi:MAG: type II toxin-antitoxin system VapC family toxin [Myxococcota bacterium]
MIAVDTNLLVYAHRRDSPFHVPARNLVRDLAESGEDWAIPWPCLHEFYSIATHPRLYSPPSTVEQALRQIEAWLASPSLHVLSEGAGHWRALASLARAASVVGPRIHDARIAALCAQHGVRELWSADRDFSRFAGFRVRNPLPTPRTPLR